MKKQMPNGRRDTIRKLVLKALGDTPGSTMTEVARIIDKDAASTSSVMLRMLKENEITRVAGVGPKGGFGYYLSNEPVHLA